MHPSNIKTIGAARWISDNLAEFKAKNVNDTKTLTDEEQAAYAELGWQRSNVVVLADHIERMYKEANLRELKILKLEGIIHLLQDKEMEA